MNPDDKIGTHFIPSPPLCVQVKQLMVPQQLLQGVQGTGAALEPQAVGNQSVLGHFTCKIPL